MKVWIPKLQLPWLHRSRGITIRSEVEVWNGKTHIRVGHNHFVDQGLINLVNQLTMGSGATGNQQQQVYSGYYTLKLGRDTTTPTTASMTTLVDEVATEPNSLSGAKSNPVTGTVRITVTATWLAGTVSGAVGELGLRWGLWSSLQSFGWQASANSNTKWLMSRISNADGDFSAFTINTGAPLTIEWRITFSFI